MAKPRPWRPAVLRLHRWIALTAGVILVLNAITGLLLLGGRPLDEALHPQLFEVSPREARVAMEPIRRSIQSDFPKQSLILRPPPEADAPLVVEVRGDAGWEGQVFVDPYTGRRLGRRARFDLGFNGLYEFHSSLLAGSSGKGLLALCAAAFAFLFCTGLFMWWPLRWQMAFRMTLGGGRLRALFDLHRVGGAVLGGFVLAASVATGGILAWRPATAWFNQVTHQPSTEPPNIEAAAGPAAPVELLIERAEAALPGGSIGSIVLPTRPTQPVRLRKKVDGDPHPYGLSTVWLHPNTAQVLRVDRWTGYSWIFTTHAGHLGGGIAGSLVTAASGLSLLGFGVSGSWLWWTRRRARAQRRPAPASS